MKIKKNATIGKLHKVKLILDLLPDMFSYLDAEKKLKDNNINPMTLYSFIYCGSLEIVKRGLYRKTVNYDRLKIIDVYNISVSVMKEKREQKKNSLSIRTVKKLEDVIHNTSPLLNEIEAIKFLKSLGYKILRQISEYKEI